MNFRSNRVPVLFLVMVAFALVFSIPAHPQNQHTNQARGFSANGAYSSFEIDHVNLFNGNLILSIPIGSEYPVNGGLSYSLNLVYNSNLWTQKEVCTSTIDFNYRLFTTWFHYREEPHGVGRGGSNGFIISWEPLLRTGTDEYAPNPSRGVSDGCYTYNAPNPSTNAGMGWQLSMGKIFIPRNDDANIAPQTTEKSLLVYQSPDGGEHTFYQKLHEDDPAGDPNVYYTRDGSYLRMTTTTFNFHGSAVIEFPNGDKHFFDDIAIAPLSQGRPNEIEAKLSRIEDQFGNYVSIRYLDDGTDTDTIPDNVWEIKDSIGRTQTVKLFKPVGTYQSVVKSVSLMAFSSGKAKRTSGYEFVYQPVTIPRAAPHVPEGVIEGHDNNVELPFLTEINLPDGSRYSMPVDEASEENSSYQVNSVNGEWTGSTQMPGLIKRVTLPTGGKIEWEYKVSDLTDPTSAFAYNYRYPHASTGLHYRRSSVGVRRRTLFDGGRYHTWKYDPRLTPMPSPCRFVDVTPECSPKEIVNKVTTPEGDYTLHYFSVYPFPQDNATPPTSLKTPHISEYGLPFTKADPNLSVNDVKGSPVFLSTQTFDKHNAKKRTTFVRYEADAFVRNDGFGNAVDTNERLATTKTVFHDDDERWTEVHQEDFDGLGHYRTTQMFSNFGMSGNKVSITDFNSGRGTYSIDRTQNQHANNFSYLPFPEGSKWILNTYAKKITGDFLTPNGIYNQKSTAYFDFEAETGKLVSKRIRKDLEGRASTALNSRDVLIKYDYFDDGNLQTERYFGGEKTGGLFEDDPRKFVSPANSEYTIDYDYSCRGQKATSTTSVLRSSKYRDADFNLSDNEVDCNSGMVISSRNASLNKTEYDYDLMNRLTLIRRHEGATTVIDYNPLRNGATTGSPTVNIFHKGKVDNVTLDEEEYVYDNLGRLVREKQKMPGGAFSVRSTSYNGLGWKTSSSEQFLEGSSNTGKKTEFENFDPFGRPGRVKLPDGKDIYIGYRGVRQIATTTSIGSTLAAGGVNLRGFTKIERYDQFGRLYEVEEASGKEITLPDGSTGPQPVTTSYEYNVKDQLVRASTLALVPGDVLRTSQVRSFTYDNLGHLLSESLPERPLASYSRYDTQGNIGTSFDGLHTLEYAYDTAGRPTAVAEIVNGSNRVLKEFTYAVGQEAGSFGKAKLKKAIRHNWVANPYTPTSTAELDVPVTEEYQYTGLDGRLGSRTTTFVNATFGSVFNQSFEYDSLGSLSKQTYPKCSTPSCANSANAKRDLTVAYGYSKGLLTNIGTPAQPGSYAPSITYHINSMISTVQHGNGILDVHGLDPNNMQRPASIGVSGVVFGVNWNSGTYQYDGAGNATEIGTDWYLYDGASRLVEGTALGAPNMKKKYSYDAFGNILDIKTFGAVTPQNPNGTLMSTFMTGVVPATNRYGLNYDNAGNALGQVGEAPDLSYDALNMVKNAKPNLTYLYGPGEERLWVVDARNASAITETFTLRGLGNEVLREYTVSGSNSVGNWTWTKDYIYRGAKLLAADSSAGTTHFHLDHLGTPRQLTDKNGVGIKRPVYLPFGEEVVPSPERLRFTGHERDNDLYQLDYMHARYYLPNGGGKFLSIDPGRDVDHKLPQSWNLYSYVRNNPLNGTDPTGRQEEKKERQFGLMSIERFDQIVEENSVRAELPATGDGFYSYDVESHRYGRSSIVAKLTNFAADWNAQHPNDPIGFGDISKKFGGDTPRHSSHEVGLNVDIRPMRNDGTQGRTQVGASTYDRTLTNELVQGLRSIPGVKSVLFNDAKIRGVTPYKGHDNHLHVTFRPQASNFTLLPPGYKIP